MEKRLIIAIALSVLVVLSWSAMSPKPPASQVAAQPQSLTQPQSQPQQKPVVIPTINELELSPGSLLKLDLGNYMINFVESQAAIQEVIFKKYNAHRFSLKHGFGLLDKTQAFKKVSMSAQGAIFVQTDANKTINKEFIIHKSNYTMDLELRVQNISGRPLPVQTVFSLGVLDFKTDPNAARFRDLAVAIPVNGLLRTQFLNGRKDLVLENPKFVALRDQYFCSIVEPLTEGYSVVVKKLSQQETEVSLLLQEAVLAPGQGVSHKFRIYLGPQDLQIIKSINPAWVAVVNYGFFDFISQILLRLLEFFHNIVHNWGLAIIILSVVIYLALYPLSIKQMRSMKAMQALQPRIEELRKACKDNPQKLHKETLELYREHKVNPFGGCLPLVLQMPIFFALYQALLRSIALKGASFLWIKDLSAPDRLFKLPVQLPVLGNDFNILPILMAIVMFVQQKMSLASASGEQAEQQKMMLIMMPILFGFIFYNMPAGLVLYWFVNSLLMMISQLKMNKAK